MLRPFYSHQAGVFDPGFPVFDQIALHRAFQVDHEIFREVFHESKLVISRKIGLDIADRNGL